MARLFIAIWPPAAVIEQLAAVPRPLDAPVRWVPEANWHLTVRFIGEADPREVADRLDRTRFPATTVRLGPALTLLGSSVVVVPATGLDGLASVVRSATDGVGIVDPRPFVGHLTVGRVTRGKVWAPPSVAVDAEFQAHQLALVGSRLAADGSRYETIGEWPIAD